MSETCEFCNGTGVQWRMRQGSRVRSDCAACEGTGQRPLPPVESWREQRMRLSREADAREEVEALETTRAATEGGPEREHGSREEDPPAEPSLPALQQTTPTRKEH